MSKNCKLYSLLYFLIGLNGMAMSQTSFGGHSISMDSRVQALLDLEIDRDAAILRSISDLPEEQITNFLRELDQLENHEVLELMANEDINLNALPIMTSYSNLSYTALEAPCRILDTRNYSGLGIPIEPGVAREVFDRDIAGQGGNATCAAELAGKSALVVSLSAISPVFPENFTSYSYGTLLNGDEIETGWTTATSLPGGYHQYTYNTPPYNKAVSVLWDLGTTIINNLVVVPRQESDPNIVLYSRNLAHYTIDVVGYFDDLAVCPSSTTFINGQCWGPQQAVASWGEASIDCAAEGGRLPSAAAIYGAVSNEDLPGVAIWADGFYYDSPGLYFQTAGDPGLGVYGATGDMPYRCIFSPLTSNY